MSTESTVDRPEGAVSDEEARAAGLPTVSVWGLPIFYLYSEADGFLALGDAGAPEDVEGGSDESLDELLQPALDELFHGKPQCWCSWCVFLEDLRAELEGGRMKG